MSIDSELELIALKRVGKIVAEALREGKRSLEPGMTTAELDAICAKVLARQGARSAPQLAYNFPDVNCISVNDEVVHGIPGGRKLRPGDLVKIDVTAELDGYIADAAISAQVPPVSSQAEQLTVAATAALQKAMSVARAGRGIGEIGLTVESEVRRRGFKIIPELCGHGVGRAIHEEPSVPNYFDPRNRQRLTDGLVITIEPIIAAGKSKIVSDPDGWTIRTKDGSLSAHVEHTIVITRNRPIIITAA
ncbi:MAG: type I methionyl aminopeptidase [Chloroflexi bacterium]|nr:type I methionyl aminopeptidase [Chloroflexota bacterium]